MSIQAQKYYYNGSKKIEIYQSKDSFILFEVPDQVMRNGFGNVEIYNLKGFTILKNKKPDYRLGEINGRQSLQISPAFKLGLD